MANSDFAQDDRFVLAYEGDAITFSRVLAALNDAGIETRTLSEHRMSLFTNSRNWQQRGEEAILVSAADAARARELVRQVLEEKPSE